MKKKKEEIIIYSMQLKNYPIELTGTLKMSKKQAKEVFGFTMNKGAKGITFRRFRSGKICMENYCPESHIIYTEERKNRSQVFKMLSKIASAHLDDLIHPVWEKLLRKKGTGEASSCS